MLRKPLNHIAIVRLSALGDVCHAMMVVASIHEIYPKAKITWITSPLEAQLVRHLEYVDVVEYAKASGLKGMLRLRQQLKNHRFDVLLHMQWSLRASLLTRMVKARVRVGFALSHSREKQHWFVNQLAPNPAGPHVLDALFSLAQAIGVETLTWNARNMRLEPLTMALPSQFIVLNPSASKPERNWTLAGYAAILEACRQRHLSVVLTGGPSSAEQALAQQLSQAYPEILNLVGKTSIAQMLSVIHQAGLLIAPDTGPVHMATLVGTPVLGLYAHSNPLRTGPYYDQEHVVSIYNALAQAEYAKPLSEISWAARVHDPEAMTYISQEKVLAKLDKMLADVKRPS